MNKVENQFDVNIFLLGDIRNRVKIIDQGLEFLNAFIQNLDEKLAILFQNDPVYEISDDLDQQLILTYVARWPLMVNALSAVFCLGASAIFHLCGIKNRNTYNFLARLDYGGISVLIMGSSYPPIFYPYACHQVFYIRNLFLVVITVSSIISFFLSLHPEFSKPKYRSIRAALYIILGLSAGAPMIYV